MSTYTPSIPQPGDIPANSQAQILGNFQSIDDGSNGFARNHVTLTNATVGQRGKHKFCELVNQASKPTGLAASEVTLYTKLGGTPSQPQLFMTRGAAGDEIQLSAGPDATVPDIITTGTDARSVTFLPGGMLLQTGRLDSPGSSGSINFIQSFSGFPISITVTLSRDDADFALACVDSDNPPTAAKFNYLCATSGSVSLFWMALGRAP